MVAMTMILRASYLSIYIGLFFCGSSCRNASACPSPPDHAAAAADEEVRAYDRLSSAKESCWVAELIVVSQNEFSQQERNGIQYGRRSLVQANSSSAGLTRCGTPDWELSSRDETILRNKMAAALKTIDKSFPTVIIPVSFQVISNGQMGNIPQKFVTDQIDVMNAAFAPHQFQFQLRETVRTDNAALSNACSSRAESFKAQLRKPVDGPNVLYIYTCPLNGLLGYATLPTEAAEFPLIDGIVIRDQSLPGGSTANFNLGQTATHEIGHW
jgi:hypothetical protein